MPTEPIIRVERLCRTFERRTLRSGLFGMVRSLASRDHETIAAVDDVSFAIAPGEMVGYIGQNGAGKSTTIKMLTGILVPSDGTVEVLGLDPSRQRKRLARRIGVVFGQRTQLWWDLPLRDSLELLRHMYRVPEARFRDNLDIAREVLDLDPFMDTPVRQLSLGQRMRGDLAAAILHDPALLVLDEPTIGLDLLAKDHIRAFLRRYNAERGVTMLLTTHDLGDIEQLCDRVIVIDHGRVQFDGAADALRAQFSDTIDVEAEFAEPPKLEAAQLPGSVRLDPDGDLRWRLRFDASEWTTGGAVRWLTTRGDVRDITIREISLEHVIREMYRGATGARSGSHVE
jgi:ABC-2 type transport system ATP-binding protein